MGTIVNETHRDKNGKEIIIRNASVNDAARLIEVNKLVVAEQLYMMREPEEAIYTIENEVKSIENHLNNAGSLYIVAVSEGVVTGYLEFQNGGLKRTSHSGMFSMFILKQWRESGIGSMLLNSLINWGKSNPKIEKLTLAVFSTNERAQALYKKFGFIEEGRCPRDMKLKDGTYIDSVLMYKFVDK